MFFYLEKYQNYIFVLFFKKFIFNINILKRFKNIKKIIKNFKNQKFKKHDYKLQY